MATIVVAGEGQEPSASRGPAASMAETYQRVAVPAMFLPSGLALLAVAAIQPGERVLDLACGTGVMARLVAPRLGAGGHVVGLDLNAEMLGMARALGPVAGAPIDWGQGNATALPFPDATFHVAFCQNGLQFIPDQTAALREMRRVVALGGRLVLSVFAREVASEAVAATVHTFLGPEVLARFRRPFSLADPQGLARLFQGVGFGAVSITQQCVIARCASADAFLSFVLGTRLGSDLARLSLRRHAALMAHARAQLAPYVTAEGLVFPVEMLVAVARR